MIEYQRAMFDAVDEIGRIADKENIDCHYRKGGMLLYATTPPRAPAAELHAGAAAVGVRGSRTSNGWTSPKPVAAPRWRAPGAMYTPALCVIDPWKLVSGSPTPSSGAGRRSSSTAGHG